MRCGNNTNRVNLAHRDMLSGIDVKSPVIPKKILDDRQKKKVEQRRKICEVCTHCTRMNEISVKCELCGCCGLALYAPTNRCKLEKWGKHEDPTIKKNLIVQPSGNSG